MIRLLNLLDDVLASIFKPFWDADTYESYSNAGYVLGLLIWMPLLFFILMASGYGTVRFDQSSPATQWLLRLLFSKFGASEPPQTLPLGYLIFVPYVMAFFLKSVRYSLGRFSARLFFAVMSGIVALGEFCIEHRWLSLLMIFSLSCAIGWGFTYLNREEKRRLSIDHSYNCWLESVEDFIEENPVTEAEKERYEKVHAAWSDDFKAVLEVSGNYNHPSECLLGLIDEIRTVEPNLSFQKALEIRLDKFDQIVGKCGPRAGAQMTPSEAKAWALMNLMMGRIYNRVAQDCHDCTHLVKAMNHFKAMNTERFKDDSEGKGYRSAQRNGFGTVYASSFSAKVLNEQVNLGDICADWTQCLIRAEQEYEAAAEGYAPCSFQQKRMRNNIADLYLRIGLNSKRLGRTITPKMDSLIIYPDKLAADLKRRAGEMMECNKTKPVISAMFLTAAQAFGTSVALQKQMGKSAAELSDDVASAGYHLRLFHSFAPANLTEKQLVYFCFAVQDQELGEKFRAALSAERGAMPMPDVDLLMQTIRNAKCR